MSGRGLLQFTLKSANDLYKHDIFGKQQPYCRVDCGKYWVKGKTCKDGGQNPTWNETMFFQITNETELLITVFAEHQLSKDAALGNAVIPIVQVRQTATEESSVPVMLKGKQAGTLHVALEFKGPSLTTFGQVAPGGTDPAGGRRALQGRRPGIYGPSSSFSPGTPSASQAPALRLASLPVRFLQQGVAASGGSFTTVPQQQQLGSPPYTGSFSGSGGLSPSSSLGQPVPLGQQPSADATAEARELLLQRQLSHPVMPPDVASLQQIYTQQLQQLQMLQTQLLGNLPPELQQHQQQQQQQLAHSRGSSSGGGQQDASQRGSGGAVDATRSSSGTDAGLQLPRQPRHTAADLFRPTSAAYTGLLSSPQASLQQLPDSDGLLEEDTDVPSVPVNFDIGRLQAIIAKVFPDSSGLNVASSGALQAQQQQQQQQPREACAVPAAGIQQCGAVAPAVTTAANSKPQQQQQPGCSVPPTSIGAFGAAAALAAAAAAGISLHNTASISNGLRGSGGAGGSAAAAESTAANSKQQQQQQPGYSVPPTSIGAFGAAAALAAAAAAGNTANTSSMLGGAGSAGSSAAAAESTAANSKQQQHAGYGVPPTSIGAFGAAAALAAAAAAGISHDDTANTSSMLGGFGGAGGSAAAAAALGTTRSSSSGGHGAAATCSSRAATSRTAGIAAPAGLNGGGGAQPAIGPTLGASSSTSSKLGQTSQQLEAICTTTSAQSAPPVLLSSTLCEQHTGRDGHALPAALSAPDAGPLQLLMDQQQQQVHQQPRPGQQPQQQQQMLLPPDVAAVMAEELNRLCMAAPMLAQVLGLAPMQQQQREGAPSTPEASTASDSSRVVVLQRQLAALQREKADLLTVLQEREQHAQQLYSQLSAQQQEISKLTAKLSQQQLRQS